MDAGYDVSLLERECNALGELFNYVITDLKNSCPIWEDFALKATKFHGALKFLLQTTAAFLDAFQRVADLASKSQGGTKELGAALTRIVMRQKTMEGKLKTFSGHLVDSVANPIQEKLEDWKKVAIQMDKDRLKDVKRVKADIKRASGESVRLSKKAQKKSMGSSTAGKSMLKTQLNLALQETTGKFNVLLDSEKQSVRKALIEERSRFCYFVSCLKPLMDGELSLLEDMAPLAEQLNDLCMHASAPHELPPESEQVLSDLRARCAGMTPAAAGSGAGAGGSLADSASSLGSRKSSMASISSLASSGSASSSAIAGTGGTTGSATAASSSGSGSNGSAGSSIPAQLRMGSVSSSDSGFISQDTLYLQGLAAMKAHDQRVAAAAAAASKAIPGEEESSGSEEDSDEDARTPSSPTATDWESQHQSVGGQRPALTNRTFQPPEMYPGCSLPPPVYSNLTELANAAKRKFSVHAGKTTESIDLHGESSTDPVLVSSHRRQTLPHIQIPPSVQQHQMALNHGHASVGNNMVGLGHHTNMAELDRAVDELDQMTTDMVSGTKPLPPRRNSTSAPVPPPVLPQSAGYFHLPQQPQQQQQQPIYGRTFSGGNSASAAGGGHSPRSQYMQQQQQQQQQQQHGTSPSGDQILSELHRHLSARRSQVEEAQEAAERAAAVSDMSDTGDPLLAALRHGVKLRNSQHKMRDRSAPNLRDAMPHQQLQRQHQQQQQYYGASRWT